jgi:hypothetical protein
MSETQWPVTPVAELKVVEGSTGQGLNETMGGEEMIRRGVMCPLDGGTVPGRDYPYAAFLAVGPLQVDGPDGSRFVDVGSRLTAAEVEYSGSAIRGLVRGQVVELDVSKGLIAEHNATLFRVRALERLIKELVSGEEAA